MQNRIIKNQGCDPDFEVDVMSAQPRCSKELPTARTPTYLWTSLLTYCIGIGLIYKPGKDVEKIELYHSNGEHSPSDPSDKLKEVIDDFIQDIDDVQNITVVISYNDTYYYLDENEDSDDEREDENKKGKTNVSGERYGIYDLISSRCEKLNKRCIPANNYHLHQGDSTFVLTDQGEYNTVARAFIACVPSLIKVIKQQNEGEISEKLHDILTCLEAVDESNKQTFLISTRVKEMACKLLETPDLSDAERTICYNIAAWDYILNSPSDRFVIGGLSILNPYADKLQTILGLIDNHKFTLHGEVKNLVGKRSQQTKAARQIHQLISNNLNNGDLTVDHYECIVQKIKNILKHKTQVTNGFFGLGARDTESVDVYNKILTFIDPPQSNLRAYSSQMQG